MCMCYNDLQCIYLRFHISVEFSRCVCVYIHDVYFLQTDVDLDEQPAAFRRVAIRQKSRARRRGDGSSSKIDPFDGSGVENISLNGGFWK